MKKTVLLAGVILFFTLPLTAQAPVDEGSPADTDLDWRVGVASIRITPENPLWMAGYANRDRPAEGTRHELFAKALALEDKDGRQALLITADIRNFPKNISDRIRDRLESDHGLTRKQIILNGSHTHTGPLMYTERNFPY